MAANVSLNNMSHVYISLPLNQVIRYTPLAFGHCIVHLKSHARRSAMPICTCSLAIFIEKQVPSAEEGSSLLLLSAGVMTSIWEGTSTGNILGISLCTLATAANAAMSCFTGRVMSEKIDALRLTFYMGPPTFCILVPLYFWLEVRAVLETL